MMKVEFDSRRLGDDIRKMIDTKGRGFARDVIKDSGVSHGTFYRLVDGPPVKNIDALLSVCVAIGLNMNDYILPGTKTKPKAKQIEIELIRPQHIEKGFRKGYLNRDFFIGGRAYKWFGNVLTPLGVVRVGVISDV